MSGPNNHTILDRRISILMRRIETSLMELTEVEVRINARVPPKQVGVDELVDARLALTSSIFAMDAELKQLRLTRGEIGVCEKSVSSSDETGHSEILRGLASLTRREEGPIPSETEGGEVVWFKDSKPHVRALTVETAPLERPDCKPAPS